LPADDERLEEWLKSQPGVIAHHVITRRTGPAGKTLKVGFLQVRNLAGEPPFPDLASTCAKLGYSGPNVKFRDCKDRENW
jgi:hypothetical protein